MFEKIEMTEYGIDSKIMKKYFGGIIMSSVSVFIWKFKDQNRI